MENGKVRAERNTDKTIEGSVVRDTPIQDGMHNATPTMNEFDIAAGLYAREIEPFEGAKMILELTGKSWPPHSPSPVRDEVEEAREWLLSGGGGFEDGEDGLRAVMVSGEGLIDFLADYAAHIRTQERERAAKIVRPWVNKAQFEHIAAAIREG